MDKDQSTQQFECRCCYDDQCTIEDSCSCPAGHLFCKECVLHLTEVAFSQMKALFPCLEPDCAMNISLATIQKVVPPNLFSKIVRRVQEIELQQANISDLVTCPHCPFAVICPDPEGTVLKCENPDCRRETCMICRQPNHMPVSCNDLHQENPKTSMRIFIENCIAEAVVRKCHRCNSRFVKVNGCNMMRCPCGATSCYACREKDIGYGHGFSKRCKEMNPDKIHKRDIQNAANKARVKYVKHHPDIDIRELNAIMNDILEITSYICDNCGRGCKARIALQSHSKKCLR